MYQSNPNQKTILTKKEQSNKDNLYSKVNINALNNAMKELKGESFKLWCYLNKNQDNYSFLLSKTDALSWGIGSKSSYDRGIAELIERGYLVRLSNNTYTFYELPQRIKES